MARHHEPAAKTIELHPGQSAAIVSKARFIAVIAGSGGGKTFTGPYWLYKEIASHPGENWMVIAPTYKILSRATTPALVDAFRGTDAEGKHLESKFQYLLPDGGIIYLCTAEKPQYLEGGQISGAWLDEAGQMKRWAWIVIQARLAVKQGRALITTTPYGQNWLYREFYQRWKNGDPDYFVSQFASTLNPHYPIVEFERLRRMLKPEEFGMRSLGLFERMTGLLFPYFDNSLVEEVHYPGAEDVRIGGIDLGWTEPSAALTGYVSYDGEGRSIIRVYRELYLPKLLMRELAQSLDRGAIYWADPSSPREIEELCQLGYTVRPAINDFDSGVRKVNEYMADRRLAIPTSICPNLISEAETYVEKETSEGPAAGQEDHLLDTLRYMIMGWDADNQSPVAVYLWGDPESERESRKWASWETG